MGLDPLTLAIVAVGSTAASIYNTQKAGRAQKRAFEAQQRKAEIENVRQARQAVRQAALARSAMINQAANTGGIGGSALAGGVSSVQSQLGGNLNFMASIAEENTAITNASIDAAKASTDAAVFGQIGQLAGTIFSAKGGFKELFKPKGTTTQ